jgi:DNA-binding transcriptional regulator YbjK
MSESYDLNVAQELAAWDQWKERCAVATCDKSPQHYLRRRVIKALRRRLQQNGVGTQGIIDDNDIVSDFDLYMAHKDGAPVEIGINKRDTTAPSANSGGERKDYKKHKDFIWKKLVDSADPPMKVLNGVLLGPRGMVNDICAWMIKRHFMAHAERIAHHESGKIFNYFKYAQHLDAPVNEEEASSLSDFLADDAMPSADQAAALSDSELQMAVKELVSSLTDDEKAVLLAKLYRMNITAPELCALIGRQKSAMSDFARKLEQKLKNWLQDNEAESLLNSSFYELLCATLLANLTQKQPLSKAMEEFLGCIKRAVGRG